MTTIYHTYAPYYDGSGQIRFAMLMGHYIAELLEHHPVAGGRALDLACGTGTLALQLADKGFDVVGVDGSAAMLEIAADKARAIEPPGSLHFVRGDMRSFAPAVGDQAAFDLVTCTYDSLNYLLSEDDLAACFANVARVLAPRGLFVADMNTRHFLEYDWDPTIVLDSTHYVQVAQSVFDPATCLSTMALTGFVGDDHEGYVRFDETHVERAYPPEMVAALLAAAGLRVEAAYDCFTRQPYYERSQRIAWVARKAED